MESTQLKLLYVMVYHRDQFLDQYFLFFTQPLSNVIKHYPVFHQMYADDTQIYECRPSEIVDTINNTEQYISNVDMDVPQQTANE